jgi:hypothetical protein
MPRRTPGAVCRPPRPDDVEFSADLAAVLGEDEDEPAEVPVEALRRVLEGLRKLT